MFAVCFKFSVYNCYHGLPAEISAMNSIPGTMVMLAVRGRFLFSVYFRTSFPWWDLRWKQLSHYKPLEHFLCNITKYPSGKTISGCNYLTTSHPGQVQIKEHLDLGKPTMTRMLTTCTPFTDRNKAIISFFPYNVGVRGDTLVSSHLHGKICHILDLLVNSRDNFAH